MSIRFSWTLVGLFLIFPIIGSTGPKALSNRPKHHWTPAMELGSLPSSANLSFISRARCIASSASSLHPANAFPHVIRTLLCMVPCRTSPVCAESQRRSPDLPLSSSTADNSETSGLLSFQDVIAHPGILAQSSGLSLACTWCWACSLKTSISSRNFSAPFPPIEEASRTILVVAIMP